MTNTTTASQPNKHGSHIWGKRLKSIVAKILIVVGCLSLGMFTAIHWVEVQVLNVDNWVSLVSPWPKQKSVADASGSYISQQIFSEASAEDKIAASLPDRANFLAVPLANQLENLTNQAAQKLVASDGFQAIWTGANRLAIGRLLANARGQQTPLQAKINQRFDVNISDVAPKLKQALGRASEAIPALNTSTRQPINISTNLRLARQRVHKIIQTIDLLDKTLPLVITASLLWAMALAQRRRRQAIIILLSSAITLLIELIAIKFLRQYTLSQVHNPGNVSAVTYIFDSLFRGLKNSIYVIIVAVAVLSLLLLVAGPTKWAKDLRSLVRIEYLHTTKWVKSLRAARLWVCKQEVYLWIGSFVAVIVGLAAYNNVTVSTVFNAGLLFLSLVAIVHIAASPSGVVNP